jgi:hypothetical protein
MQAQDAASLRARHGELHPQLANNLFRHPVYIESSEQAGQLQGDIYALINQPYALVSPALQGMQNWCDILILHLNVKRCLATTPPAGDTLSLNIGRKFDQPLADGYEFEFLHQSVVTRADYLQIEFKAATGPLGTSRYRIMLEVVKLNTEHSFLHLSYSYTSSRSARAAMRGYLATIGRDKVGFSVVGKLANGQTLYINNLRGVIERNTMRYYLAIEAYLGALSVPADRQLEQRLNDWHTSVERYPVQLHELERSEYLAMKRNEIQRQTMYVTTQ